MKGQVPRSGDSLQPPDGDEYAVSDETLSNDQRVSALRRLRPQSRINPMAGREKPEMMTPLPQREAVKKAKPTKWQFGIRSRNSPSEAMLAIYKALKAMGAVWETTRIRRPGHPGGADDSPDREGENRRRRPSHREEREGSQSPEYSDSDPASGTDPEYATHEERTVRRNSRRDGSNSNNASASSSDGMGPDPSSHHSRSSSHKTGHKSTRHRHQRGRERHGPWNDWGYHIPEDPWVINARFRKDGMFPPGIIHPSSAYSSRVDLTEAGRRRSSTMGSSTSLNTSPAASTPPLNTVSSSHGSTHPSAENVGGGVPGSMGSTAGSLRRGFGGHYPNPDESAWVYVTIQLYCIEADSYMVDFKCAGYERLVRRLRREIRQHSSSSEGAGEDNKDEWRAEGSDADDEDLDEGYMGAGRASDEKDISSPFPFMDVAASLIVQLAQGS